MQASKNPIETTGSRCAPQTARGRHVFEIAGYSLQKGVGPGKFIKSATFAVGGHDWRLRFYPDGDSREDCNDYVSAYLDLISKADAEVRVLYAFRLVTNPVNMISVPVGSVPVGSALKPIGFSSLRSSWGFPKLKKKSELEGPPFVRDDRLVLLCDITVIMGTPEPESRTMYHIQVPPSDLVADLGKLLESQEGVDVAFKVKNQVFHAHKIVLAMRSPVFKAELYGPIGNKRQGSINVKDMLPPVFKALLHFAYTDSLPEMDYLDEDENEEMVKHLLAAADRYAMERMKSMCAEILCKKLDVKRVAGTLAIADQHHCSKLKDVCIQFINSLSRMDDIVESKGYVHLKRACPTVFVDLWEQSAKSRRL
ncbi:hypothetical protein BS78_07G088600 [Paspalum vaginatum]|nr:hypothetical protein BS78_07G088600 [Paspalum vaginatum]